MSAEHRRVAAFLRLHAAHAEHQAEALLRHAADARVLANDLEGESPPPLEQVRQRGVALFRRRTG